jgi:hypothetical protein
VVGGIVFAFAMVIVVPVGVMLAGGAWSALFGEMYAPVDDASAPALDAEA